MWKVLKFIVTQLTQIIKNKKWKEKHWKTKIKTNTIIKKLKAVDIDGNIKRTLRN